MIPWSTQAIIDGDDEKASCDILMLPPGFETKNLLEWAKCKAKTTIIQQRATLALVEERVSSCSSVCWNMLVKEVVLSWWNNHCSADIVRWSMALHGLPWSVTTSKSQMVEVLMKYQALPIPFEQISAFDHLWLSISEEERNVISAKHPPTLIVPQESPSVGGAHSVDHDIEPSAEVLNTSSTSSSSDSSSSSSSLCSGPVDMRELLAGMHAGISALVDFANSSRSANASANAIDVSGSDTISEGKSGESRKTHEESDGCDNLRYLF